MKIEAKDEFLLKKFFKLIRNEVVRGRIRRKRGGRIYVIF